MEESVVIAVVIVLANVLVASGDAVNNIVILLYGYMVYYNMSKAEILVTGLETVITNAIKILLVGILVGVIGIAVWAYLNPQQFFNGIISILPMLAIGLIVIALAAKIKLAVK